MTILIVAWYFTMYHRWGIAFEMASAAFFELKKDILKLVC